MTVLALYLSIALGAVSLAWGFYSAGLVSFSVWFLIFGGVWLLAIQQNWDWFSSLGLLCAVLVAAFGLFLKLPPSWMFSGGLFALFAWDLTDFRVRMRMVVRDENTRKMEQRHIARVTLLALFGAGLASVSMFLVRAEFTLEWAALLVLIVLLGLAQLVGWFKRQ
jgi:hypothetical protein